MIGPLRGEALRGEMLRGEALRGQVLRHPLDPEPARSTKANAVLVLGIVALATGPFVGGIVPAVVALVLARQARADLLASRGYLTGADRLRRGERLALIGLALGVVTLVVAAVAAVLAIAGDAGSHDFSDRFD
jgi:(hydroxyamino)benzene mutase